MKKIVLFSLLVLLLSPAFSQNPEKENKIMWSFKNRLSPGDFTFRKSDSTHPAFGAIFSMEYSRSMFSSPGKSILNIMLRNASWIDTSLNIERQISFVQDLFDINEIYIRRLRKKVSESFNNSRALKKYYSVYMAEAAVRQGDYNSDVLYNKNLSDLSKQIKWEETIRYELLELRDYSIEKSNF